jgi:DNA mismatch repair ATPase MutS
MEIDKTTLYDLSVFNYEEEFSLFSKLNYCRTLGGKEQLRFNFSNPLKSMEAINGIQETLKLIMARESLWPGIISNGTIMVMEKFYESSIDQIPGSGSSFAAAQYKFFHGPDHSLVKYSAGHCFDFIKGLQQLTLHFLDEHTPPVLKTVLEEIKKSVYLAPFSIVEKHEKASGLSNGQLLQLASFIRYHFKNSMFDLIQQYNKLDAWYGMAMAVRNFGLVFPRFVEGNHPVIQARELYHLLLQYPVSYDVELDKETNFLFLTGANMAGKSTFIKSAGSAVFLAHTGMGVPAKEMNLSFFDGILSNINVVDNLVKGESYFYNEVQRIKATVTKINDGRKWLILIDELFKGTNVQDAMKCSLTVIEGLLKIRNSLFVLSTHLYEIGEDLKTSPHIHFKYFETSIVDGQLRFSYQLKDGISNDRLGYLILKKEGVVDLLENI